MQHRAFVNKAHGVTFVCNEDSEEFAVVCNSVDCDHDITELKEPYEEYKLGLSHILAARKIQRFWKRRRYLYPTLPDRLSDFYKKVLAAVHKTLCTVYKSGRLRSRKALRAAHLERVVCLKLQCIEDGNIPTLTQAYDADYSLLQKYESPELTQMRKVYQDRIDRRSCVGGRRGVRDTPCPHCPAVMTTRGIVTHISRKHGPEKAIEYKKQRY